MGQVWSAVHVVTGRRVAIKRLLLAGDDNEEDYGQSEARARFILEAQAACAVEHPNVVEILDFVEPGDEPPLLVMELLQGETLAAKLDRERTLSLDETVNVLLPVVSAVGTAHSRGIIHRDLKPANIFLQQRSGQDRVVKVLDFGIAKWVAERPEGAGLRTQTGSTLGTPCYMSPEQAIGERLINHTADIWSLGIIFYECLAGARPVEGENAAQLVARLLSTGIMPIERVVPTLPRDVAQLIGQMLSRDATRRPTDLRPVFDVLRAHSTRSAPAFSEPSLAVDTTSEPAELPRVAQSAPSWQGQSVSTQVSPTGRLRSRSGVVLALALPTVALLTYLLSRQSSAPAASVLSTPSASRATATPAASASESLPLPEQSGTPGPAALPTPTPHPDPAQSALAHPTPAPNRARADTGKSAAQVKRPARPTPQDEDGTSDRK